jgi:ABC-type cobalamin/Fe3+-siderophores transport system ATPase subunit
VADLLSLRGVHKGYLRGGVNMPVLRDVSLDVGEGEVVAVVSSRGEGKSTLLRVAAGMECPGSGGVWFRGRDLARCSDAERSRLLAGEIAWTDREGPGLRLTVRDFVGLSSVFAPKGSGRRRRGRGRREARASAERALDRVGAADTAGKRWEDLSDRERVLVGFARGIVGAPRLMVVDGLLDRLGMRATQEAGDLLRSLVEESTCGCGVLLSASDMEAALVADRVWVFERHGLNLMSDQTRGPAEIIGFPGAARASRDSRSTG